MTVLAHVVSLLLLAAAIELAAPQDQAVVVYRDVPREVVQIVAFEWQDNGMLREVGATIERKGGGARVRGPRGRLSAIFFKRADGRYLVDGPFTWPGMELQRETPRGWRRTVTGSVSDETPMDTVVAWVAASPEDAPWPRCVRADHALWQCAGVGAATRGVVTISGEDDVRWSVIGVTEPGPLRSARWGRLLVVDGLEHTQSPVRAALAYPVPPPPERLVSARLDTAPVAGAQSAIVSSNSVWIAGPEPPAKAWLELRTDEQGPTYLALQDVADSPRGLPVHVRLAPRRTIAGRVAGADGTPARGALVTVFRAIDPLRGVDATLVPRRVVAAETVVDDHGAFVVDGLGEGDYEIVAWHSQLGRASVNLDPAQTSVAVALHAAGIARGRVIAGGKPLAGIDVISVPDRATFNAARDVTEIKGGDARTGADGRFTVMLASAGGGELRIAGGSYAVRRVPLPRPAVAVVDLGDIELPPGIDVKIVFDRAVDCTLRAVGPIGRTGMQVVTAVRNADGTYAAIIPEPGVWQLALACAAGRHPLSPSTVQITPAHAGKELHFVVK